MLVIDAMEKSDSATPIASGNSYTFTRSSGHQARDLQPADLAGRATNVRRKARGGCRYPKLPEARSLCAPPSLWRRTPVHRSMARCHIVTSPHSQPHFPAACLQLIDCLHFDVGHSVVTPDLCRDSKWP